MGRRSHSSESAWGPEHAERIREDLLEEYRAQHRVISAVGNEWASSMKTVLDNARTVTPARLSDDQLLDRIEFWVKARGFAGHLMSGVSNVALAQRELPSCPFTWVSESAMLPLAEACEWWRNRGAFGYIDSTMFGDSGLVMFEQSAGSFHARRELGEISTRTVSIDGLFWSRRRYAEDAVFYENDWDAGAPDGEDWDEADDDEDEIGHPARPLTIQVLTRNRAVRRVRSSAKRRPLVVPAGAVRLPPGDRVLSESDLLPARLLGALHFEACLSPFSAIELQPVEHLASAGANGFPAVTIVSAA
ncbi:hypothetical protein RD149_01465 [Gordonia westfalica]|uniref:Uncharacterized protein n=1 Tax=Gordonia westfalica TaxID=158898 RepID=A0ABU2GLT5_9ACTN|nr:hypothetical protein [Gordonia westfalica]MDS1112427.1 hypothetical protein [Gordonia westfalica]